MHHNDHAVSDMFEELPLFMISKFDHIQALANDSKAPKNGGIYLVLCIASGNPSGFFDVHEARPPTRTVHSETTTHYSRASSPNCNSRFNSYLQLGIGWER